MSDFTLHRRWHLSETVCSAEALQRPKDVTWMQKKKKKKENACSCNSVNWEQNEKLCSTLEIVGTTQLKQVPPKSFFFFVFFPQTSQVDSRRALGLLTAEGNPCMSALPEDFKWARRSFDECLGLRHATAEQNESSLFGQRAFDRTTLTILVWRWGSTTFFFFFFLIFTYIPFIPISLTLIRHNLSIYLMLCTVYIF